MKAWIRRWLGYQSDPMAQALLLVSRQSEALQELAKAQQLTIDRVVAAKFERPQHQPIEMPAHMPAMGATDMVDVLLSVDDETFDEAMTQ